MTSYENSFYLVTVQNFENDVEEYKFTFLETAIEFMKNLDFNEKVNFAIISLHQEGEL